VRAVDLKELELLEGRSTFSHVYPPTLHLAIGAVAAIDLRELELLEGQVTSSQSYPSMLHLAIKVVGKEKG
jgi:hypothetical protein